MMMQIQLMINVGDADLSRQYTQSGAINYARYNDSIVLYDCFVWSAKCDIHRESSWRKINIQNVCLVSFNKKM